MAPANRPNAHPNPSTPAGNSGSSGNSPTAELLESASDWFEEATDLASQLTDYRGLILGPVIPVPPSHIDPGALAWTRSVRTDRRPESPEATVYYLIAPHFAEEGRQKGPSPIHDVDWVEFVWTELVGGPAPGWILVKGAPRDSVVVHFARTVANQIAENSA
jgi:hypothetical protein